ncbi:ssDNA-binding protein, partial [Morganella morganii]
MKVKLTNVRLAFPELFEATQVNGQGDFKFRATFLIDKKRKDLIDAIEQAIKKVATDKWGAKAESVLKSIRGNSMRFNFRDGDEKAEYDGYADHMYIGASNKAR